LLRHLERLVDVAVADAEAFGDDLGGFPLLDTGACNIAGAGPAVVAYLGKALPSYMKAKGFGPGM
jgi:hypothetical protein